jgi:hypothetical protein
MTIVHRLNASVFIFLSLGFPGSLPAAESVELKVVPCRAFRFTGGNFERSHWSALLPASNGKIYVGVSTHGDSGYVYEFDPETEKMTLLANLSILAEERGKGIWTTGKIHVQMQELDGFVYFGALDEDSGPPAIDPSSYRGPHWYRINISNGRVERLGLINSFWGLTGQAMDKRRRLIYGLAENGHLYRYIIDEDTTEDLGRVDDWDICRTIFMDDIGNVYGNRAGGRIWKYDVARDRVFDLEDLRLPIISRPRSLTNPMLDRRSQWRIIEWHSEEKVAYGITGGDNLLFKYDVHRGPEGTVTPLVMVPPPNFRGGDPMTFPGARLAMTISYKEHKIYYLPEMMGGFDYADTSFDVLDEAKFAEKMTGSRVAPLAYLLSYDLETGQVNDLGLLKTQDGRFAYGMDGAQADQDGKIWFAGAFEEPDPDRIASLIEGKYPYSLGLGVYDPFATPEN